MKVLETERLILRRLTTDDAPFILELLNDAAFLHFIGDKGVRTREDARQYILQGPMQSYEQLGFGLYLVSLKDSTPIGMCGLIKRDALEDVDIGFALMPDYRASGYGFESAIAVRDYAMNILGLQRLLAITNQDNVGSIKVLEKIGLKFDRMIRLTPDAPEIRLYRTD
ncbi:MAG TPA: GNAT family N-acetyltransferase [Pyrinomonadaceae bacterium]|nr:GNAT family N-acetyltransferase [Pyrinomonadaceae bacterium]